ncbi:hypothetical protein [Salinarimonas sp.]|uniref:hypothetical protein n=1 Tax=Salinarimonas sp. TaxID=2766526 RepID=UPI0032D92C2B
MFAALYGLAAVMVLAGAWAVFAGWELLLLERGWSMLIAGATLATGGLVLGGVAAVAQALAKRLDALGEAVRAAARTQAPAFPKRPTPAEATGAPVARAEPVPPPPAREIEPKVPQKIPPQEPVAPAGPAPVAALGIGGVAAEAVAPGATRPAPEPEGGLPPLDLGTSEPEPEERGRVGEEPVEADLGERDRGEEERAEEERAEEERAETERATPVSDAVRAGEAAQPAPEPEPEDVATSPAPEPVPGAAAAAGPGIEEPVVGRRERGRIEAEAQALSRRLEESAAAFGVPAQPQAAPAPDAREEEAAGEEVDRLAAALSEPAPPREPGRALAEVAEETEAEAAPANAPEAEDAALGESPAEPAAEAPGAPVVVGTHVSGANRYVMYSDGSIEAETPEGRLLFGSIDELKGYIASAGQDPTGASQTEPR